MASLGDKVVEQRVAGDAREALESIRTKGTEFIVNDSAWYWPNDRGKVMRCVVNSAQFISGQFSADLVKKGWTCPATIQGQEIDGYIELPVSTPGFSLAREVFFDFLRAYVAVVDDPRELDRICAYFFQTYVKRRVFGLGEIPEDLHHYLTRSRGTDVLRVGMEFETGNIASSFRAFTKLNFLYTVNKIDAALFVTAIDKANCAGRIWPTSNRNGSFEELKRRQYAQAVLYPAWELGFAPDGFSPNASYLGANGSLYEPVRSGTRTVNGAAYEVWIGQGGRELLRPVEHD